MLIILNFVADGRIRPRDRGYYLWLMTMDA